MSAKVKLCGMTRPEDILVARKLNPDYVGFVFWPKSKRFLTREQATELREMLPSDIPAVGVFVDEDPEVILSLVGAGVIQVVQLHGHETEET
ncbi:MAG: phosphoribosylanthranilate isomerase, partial [Clostridia bacterium]|nr:phosphoribosylanthranilate isomerase [Clostridia bacterium]